MTREEFVRNNSWVLKGIRERCELTQAETDYLNSLIEVLEQEPCEECISRKAVLNTLDSMDKALTEDRTVEEYKAVLEECYKVLPSIQPKPKTGEWVQDLDGTYLCSECGSGFKEQPTLMGNPMFLWCPLCGAKMESEDKE